MKTSAHRDGFLLAPGAGSDRDEATLVAIDQATSEFCRVRRFDFYYRREKRRAPDREPKLLAALLEEAQTLTSELKSPARLVMGGRSMGGRMASLAAARGLVDCDALVLVSYPLHPPGKPEKLRDEHFVDLAVPCLFISGTRDAFGSVDELIAATQKIPGEVTLNFKPGGDHGLKKFVEEIAADVRQWLTSVLR